MSDTLKVLFIGDVVGEQSVKALADNIGAIIEKYSSDFIIVNGENVWNGKGLNEDEAKDIFDLGADVITTGNHIWENWKSRPLLAANPKVLRPYNYPTGNPGRGYAIVDSKKGVPVAVLQLQGRSFMQTIDCPFRGADSAMHYIQPKAKITIIDFHAETTAEKVGLGWHLDGKVSAIIGTHTHIQTADAQILPEGTAYITDVGMTGPYDSVLGLKKDIGLKRALLQTAHKYEVAEGPVSIAGVSIEIDIESGLANSIESFMYPNFNKIRK